MKDFFIKEKTLDGRYLIKVNFNEYPLQISGGSFSVIEARVMGLTYANYLRMCRDIFGAEIEGKNSLYPTAYFKYGEGLHALIKHLNARMTSLLFYKEFPYHLKENEKGEIEKILF